MASAAAVLTLYIQGANILHSEENGLPLQVPVVTISKERKHTLREERGREGGPGESQGSEGQAGQGAKQLHLGKPVGRGARS